jgi:uncharacterized membrane protein
MRVRKRRPDRGSVLMLLPACVLVVIVLASIAVDMAMVHLRQREALDLAASAANDAVTAGADPDRLRAGGFDLDAGAVQATVDRAIAASDLAPHLAGRPTVRIAGDTVEVSLTVEADYLFTGALPGTPEGTTVHATASATAVQP